MYRYLSLFLFFSTLNFAQNVSQNYNLAYNCFLNEDYICAKNSFFHIIKESPRHNKSMLEYASYYHFLSSLRLYHADAGNLFANFIENFPLSNKKTDAIFFMSEHLFEQKDYNQVIHLLSQINLYQLHQDRKDFAFFYLGYSCYQEGKNELAKSSLYELITSFSSPFRDDAIFYNAQILLTESNHSDALNEFRSLVESEKYRKEVPYFIANILFDFGEYQAVADYLEPLLDPTRCNYYSDLLLLHAKSLYHLKDYDAAVVYFEEYKSLVGTLTEKELYQIGFSYYQKGLHGFAINHFNKITETVYEDLAQYAFYYLGDSYRETNNHVEAMNAFRSASLFSTDSVIQHDAFYQFALLCYEQTNPLYNPIHYLTEFINSYPDSEHIDQIYTCLANTYLNSYDYDKAINVLEKSNFLDENLRNQYQKICFHRGVQLYNDALYDRAIQYFDKAISVPNTTNLLYESYFWRGESYYNLNLFNKALDSYKNLAINSDLYARSLYAQGYCLFKIGDYTSAVKVFKNSLNYQHSSNVLYDMYVRIADSYFSLMEYEMSAIFYDKALAMGGFQDDYSAYKKSTSFILLENYTESIVSLNELINRFPNSNYLDDAIFDLGNTYIAVKEFNQASVTFLKIINNFPNSLFFSSSKLKLGLVYYMQEEDQKAIAVLKEVVSDFPNTNVSEEALRIIKNIYTEIGEANLFLELLKNVEHDYTKSELDSATYYAAELQYMQNNYKNAISSLSSYLSYYPEGLFLLEANYYLHKSHEQLGDLEKSLQFLNQLINEKENKYTIQSVRDLARINYQLGKYISAEKHFTQLLEIAPTVDIKQYAILGLLESEFKLYKYEEVLNDIDALFTEDFFSVKDNLRIKYLKAYSLYVTGNQSEALKLFDWLVENSDGDLKAESYFYIAQISHNTAQYNRCQEVVFQLINELPSYELWVDKSLLLLAQNYIIQQDMFQAKHVLSELKNKTKDTIILNHINTILIDSFSNSNSDSLIQKK